MIPSPSSRASSLGEQAQGKAGSVAARTRQQLNGSRRQQHSRPDDRLLDNSDPQAPQREAALFYGLFLRGHSADDLRRDIDVPQQLQTKLLKRHSKELGVQSRLNRAYMYRKQVLAIFDELITRQRIKERVH